MRIISSQSFFLYAARPTVISTAAEWRNLRPQRHQCLPSHCHFDRNGAKRSGVEKSPPPMAPVPPPPTVISTETEQCGVEWRNLRPQWRQCLPLPLSFRPKRSGVEWSGEISSPNGTSASPSHCHFDRNGAKRSGVEKSPAPMAQPHCGGRSLDSEYQWSSNAFILIPTCSSARDDMLAGSSQSWGTETNDTDTTPSHCHFDRNGAKRSGVEKSPAPMLQTHCDRISLGSKSQWSSNTLTFLPIRSPARDDRAASHHFGRFQSIEAKKKEL